jgi:hypothetical protein
LRSAANSAASKKKWHCVWNEQQMSFTPTTRKARANQSSRAYDQEAAKIGLNVAPARAGDPLSWP